MYLDWNIATLAWNLLTESSYVEKCNKHNLFILQNK